MDTPHTRLERQQILLELVISQDFRTQEILQEALEARGCVVTQSSISRDIRALGLKKSNGVYIPSRESLTEPGTLKVWQSLLRVEIAGPHMIVLHCSAAMASPIAAALDDGKWPGIAGTVAGDDTLFIALSCNSLQSAIVHRIQYLSGLS